MSDTKISALSEATTLDGTEDIPVVQTSTKRVGVDTMFSSANALWQGWVFPNDAGWVGTAGVYLSSTSWDGDAYSDTAKTLIDLSAVFGCPAGIRAVNVWVRVNDSGSAGEDCYLILSNNNTAASGFVFNCPRSGNDHLGWHNAIVPCDANGDLYFQAACSGTGTMDVYIRIFGYLF